MRLQAAAALAVAGVALIVGLLAMRGDEDEARGLEKYAHAEAARRHAAQVTTRLQALDLDDEPAAPAGLAVAVTVRGPRLDGRDVTTAEVIAAARAAAAADPTIVVTVSFDDDVPWNSVIELMDALRGAGLQHVALGATPRP